MRAREERRATGIRGGRFLHSQAFPSKIEGSRENLPVASLSLPDPLPDRRPHLRAALLAAAIFVAIAAGGSFWAKGLVARRFDVLHDVMAEDKPERQGQPDPDKATYLGHLNSLGTTLQAEAFSRDDHLLLYGSSELSRPVAQKASLFFRDYPTGFAIHPVGRAATDAIIFLQRIASLGPVTRGKRVALSFSPTWFLTGRPDETAYASNFSSPQVLRSLLNRELDLPLRREMAQRFLLHPVALKSDRLVRFLATHLAGDRLLDRAAIIDRLAARRDRAGHPQRAGSPGSGALHRAPARSSRGAAAAP